MNDPKFLFVSLCFFTVFQLSLGVDTLSPDQPLADGDVLISPDQTFTLGFFSPGKSTNRYLGIWYTTTPDVVIWLANRNNPIVDSTGALTLHPNGTQVLSSVQRAKIWSSDSSRPASSPVLKLLETGNLVLEYDAMNIWQSFDHPTDHTYPGIGAGESRNVTSWRSADDPSSGEYSHGVENNGLSQLIYTKGTKKIMRIVFWNGDLFGIPNGPYRAWAYEVLFNSGRISYFSPFFGEINMRMLMNYNGQFEHYMMNEEKDGWNLTFSLPRDKCDIYGHCGNNSICRIYKLPICECLRGFKPKSEKEWRMFNWESGCTRSLPPSDCQKDYGFLKVNRIQLPDSLNFRLNTSMAIDECRNECLKNCDCTAYADPYFSNGSSCLMWFGDLIDIREHIEEADDGPSLYLRMPLFDFETIAAATNNFSGENLIGEGGFGPVYKVIQHSTSIPVSALIHKGAFNFFLGKPIIFRSSCSEKNVENFCARSPRVQK